MTTENWITIATIISANILALATFLAPSLAEIVKARINQPKASPVTNKPKSLIRWIVRLVGPLLCIVFEIYLLNKELHSSAPLDRVAVGFIAGLYASIVGITLFVFVIVLFRSVFAITEGLMNLHRQQFQMFIFLDTIQKGNTKIIFDELDKLAKTPKVRPQSNQTLDSMLNAIKKILF